jgi:hypothetical protein
MPIESENGAPPSDPKQTGFSGLVIIAVLVVVACVVYVEEMHRLIPLPADRANFGDMFGALNTVFSGLALAGVIYAIFLQRNELALQRAELALTRDEMKQSVAAQQGAEDALKRQVGALHAQAIALYRPYITVTARLTRTDVEKIILTISNAGKTSARNVHLSIDQDFFQRNYQEEWANIRTSQAFTQPIETFPPGFELTFELIRTPSLHIDEELLERTPLVFRLTARYEHLAGELAEQIDETTVVDLRLFRFTAINRDPVERATRATAEELKRLTDAVKEHKNELVRALVPPVDDEDNEDDEPETGSQQVATEQSEQPSP